MSLIKIRGFLGLASLIFASLVFAKENLTTLETAVQQQDYQQAWKQAKQLAKTHEGDPRFDYLYGLSALETGHYDLAVFALDRVTVNQPNVLRPRLELARAYLKVKNDIAALREFEEVLRLNPPPTVRRNVSRYIQAINKASNSSRKWIIDGLITLATGYDTNANFGAEHSVFETPVFGAVTLKESSLKQDSPFVELRTQINAQHIVSDARSWFIKTQLMRKNFTDAKAFNLSALNLQGGSTFAVGRQQYQLSLRHQFITIDDHAFSNTLGLRANFSHEVATNQVLAASFLLDDYDHKQQNLRDARHYGVSSRYRFSKNNTRYQLGLSVRHERPKQLAGKQHTRNTTGVSYAVEHAWNAVNSSFVNTQFEYRKHRASDPIYAKKRRDNRLLLKVGHTVRVGKKLSLFAHTGYTKNNSNLDIYDTNKAFVKMGVNYNF
jgi:tetratricopeptide (TPR) repeat protein